MPENESRHDQAESEPAPPPAPPQPPPFDPDVELIGYIDRGLKPSIEKRPKQHEDER